MPTVPEYQVGQTQSRGINARQSISAPADAFGANVARKQVEMGKTLQQSSDIASERALTLRDRHDDAVLREMDTNLSVFIRDKLDDPQSGFLSMRGKDALNARSEVEKLVREFEEKQRKPLDKRLIERWSKVSSARLNGAMSRIDAHTRTEFKNYEEITSKARIDNQVDEMASHVGDTKAINLAKAVGLKEIEQQAERLGWDAEVLKREKETFTSKGHLAVINRLIASQQPSVAQQYYNDHKTEILGTSRDDIEAVLNRETALARAQKHTDQIMADPDLDFEQQLEKAREITNPTERESTVALVKERQGEIGKAKTRKENEAYDAVQKHFANGGSLKDLPSGLWDQMSGTQQSAINKALKEARNSALNPTDPVASKKLFYTFQRMATENPVAFKQLPLSLYIGVIDEGDLDKLNQMQSEPNQIELARSRTSMINSALASLDLDPKELEKDSSEGDRVRAFYQRIDDRVSAFSARTGKQPDDRQFQEMVLMETNNMVHRFDRASLDETMNVGTMTPDDLKDAYVKVGDQQVFLADIPEVERAYIIDLLIRSGVQPTEQAIAEMYVEAEKGGVQ